MIRRTSFVALFSCLAFLGAASAASAADDPLLAPVGTCPSDGQLGLSQSAAQQSMLCLTNWARTKSGLPALQLNATLNAAGNAKLAADVSCGQFSHTPCGNPFSEVLATYLSGANGYSSSNANWRMSIAAACWAARSTYWWKRPIQTGPVMSGAHRAATCR